MRQEYVFLALCALGLLVMILSLKMLHLDTSALQAERFAGDGAFLERYQGGDPAGTFGANANGSLLAILSRRVENLEVVNAKLVRLMSIMQRRAADEVRLESPGCSFGVGNLTSSQAMKSNGWKLDVDNTKGMGGQVSFWQSDKEYGAISFRLMGSGRIALDLKNDHDAKVDDNVVVLWLNSEPLAGLGALEGQTVCVTFRDGDVITITEVFGIICLRRVEIRCDLQHPAGVIDRGALWAGGAAAGHTPKVAPCFVGQQVWVVQLGCGEQKWRLARLDRIIDETHALVELLRGSPGSVSRWQMHSLQRLSLTPDASSPHCAVFAFRRERVGIVMVIDGKFRDRYSTQIASQRCLATARDYDFWLLDPRTYPVCDRFETFTAHIFFEKHCVVAQFLAEQEPGYTAVVIDADVVAVVLERGFEAWLAVGSDLQFYERLWSKEIASGNYIARNTLWARRFLMNWAEYSNHMPPGFSSYDNGALHLHIVDALQIEGADRCKRLYNGLDQDGHVNLTKYWQFVECTKDVLGPPRTWNAREGGRLTVWPRMHSFILDGMYVGYQASNVMGPLLHHGIKEVSMVERYYYSDLKRCELKTQALRTREGLGKVILQTAWRSPVILPSPQLCPQCNEACMSTLSCRPLQNSEAPVPRRTCSDCV